MPQIDFYILADSRPDARLGTACRIIEKATRQRNRVLVSAATDSDARALDELLWTFSDISFVPHRLLAGEPAGMTASASAEEPVLITCADAAVDGCDLLVNLSDRMPDDVERYSRIVEVVTNAPEVRQAGRERYRDYRARGFELNVHNL